MNDKTSIDISPERSNELIRSLNQATDNELPASVRGGILAAGSAILTDLIEVVTDYFGEAENEGWPGIHAVRLLGEIKDPRAIPTLLDCLKQSDIMEFIQEDSSQALAKFGDAALEPCLTAYDATTDDEYRTSLAMVLSKLGLHDERILKILIHVLHQQTSLGAP